MNIRGCKKSATIMQKIIVIIFISHKYTSKQANTLLVSFLDNLIVWSFTLLSSQLMAQIFYNNSSIKYSSLSRWEQNSKPNVYKLKKVHELFHNSILFHKAPLILKIHINNINIVVETVPVKNNRKGSRNYLKKIKNP